MKTQSLLLIALLACVAATISPSNNAPTAAGKITGVYVEARTASVFAGACHYNGEVVTTGRDAIMAWSFTSGSYNGVDLSGVRAVAAVNSQDSLGLDIGARKWELTIDAAANDRQAAAVQALIEAKSGAHLGKLVSVRRLPISFTHSEDTFNVEAPGFASLSVQPMADNLCCKSPNLVWYYPLTPLAQPKVGMTQNASFTGTIADPWSRSEENGAYYGTFAF